jgi:hypothetical protein
MEYIIRNVHCILFVHEISCILQFKARNPLTKPITSTLNNKSSTSGTSGRYAGLFWRQIGLLVGLFWNGVCGQVFFCRALHMAGMRMLAGLFASVRRYLYASIRRSLMASDRSLLCSTLNNESPRTGTSGGYYRFLLTYSWCLLTYSRCLVTYRRSLF